MTLPGRTYSSPAYRYGFQGQEKDDELKGEGNSLNYTFRMHDPRVGRFFAVDPLAPQYPWYTPYQFSGNRLIDMGELEGLEPDEKGKLEGETSWSTEGHLTNEKFSLFIQLFSIQKWTWHCGSSTTNEGWYKTNEYKEVIMPFALDAASFNGFKIGSTWQEAWQLIGQQGDHASGLLSDRLIDFLSTRTFAGGNGIDILSEIGEGRMRTINGNAVSKVSGAVTPLGYEDPFVFGLASGAKRILSNQSKLFYTVQGAEDASRLLNGGFPFPTGQTKSFLGEGVYAFGSKADAIKYKSLLQNFGAGELEIMTFRVSKYNKLKVFDMRGLSDEAANAWLESFSYPKTHNFEHVIRPAGNFDEYFFSKDIFNNLKF